MLDHVMRSRALALWVLTIPCALSVASCEQILGIQPVPVPDAMVDVMASETSTSDGGVGDAGDAAPSNCGAFGQPCCDGGACGGGAQCLVGADAGSRCVAFGGTFEKASTTTCGVVSGCVNGNPAAGGACACPAGWTQPQSSAFDVACNDSLTAPSHLTGELDFCSGATMPAGSDWGGAFVSADIPACEPGNVACIMKNPFTNDCTCPTVDAGVESVALRVFVPGYVQDGGCQNPELGGTLTVCLPKVTPTTLLGVFEQDGTGVCRVHSQALTGCGCPQGSSAVVRSIEEAPQGCTNTCTFPLATITFCMAL